MHEPDFWAGCAEAMELSIEGNRLIAREIADGVRSLWRRMVGSLDVMLQGLTTHERLPPI